MPSIFGKNFPNTPNDDIIVYVLLDFSISNYKCFAEEAHLSFVRPSLKTQVPRDGQSWADVTYQVAAVYGANASGKSTLLEALTRFSSSIAGSDVRLFQPHASKLESNEPTVYSANFTQGGVRYTYTVEAHPWGISRESLYSYPRGTRKHVFTRSQEKGGELVVKAAADLRGPTAEVRKVTTSHDLFLASSHRYQHKTLAAVARGLRLDSAARIVSHDESDRSTRIRWVMTQMAKGEEWQTTVNEAARMADLGIKRIELREKDIPLEILDHVRDLFLTLNDEEDEDVELPDELLASLRRSLVFIHSGLDGREFELSLNAQSDGTITWLASMIPAIDALRSGRLLIVDELDASLHPDLARALVELFKSPTYNQSGAQILFSTHDVSLLGNSPVRLLEPGEVWFCEKDPDGGSELVSLLDYDNREGNNNQRRYLAGKFGAIPNVDLSRLLKCSSVRAPATSRKSA